MVEQSATVKTTFAGLFLPSFNVSAQATASEPQSGQSFTPINVEVVIDSTPSMGYSQDGGDCSGQVTGISPQSQTKKIDCAKAGIRALLAGLFPCDNTPPKPATCQGNATTRAPARRQRERSARPGGAPHLPGAPARVGTGRTRPICANDQHAPATISGARDREPSPPATRRAGLRHRRPVERLPRVEHRHIPQPELRPRRGGRLDRGGMLKRPVAGEHLLRAREQHELPRRRVQSPTSQARSPRRGTCWTTPPPGRRGWHPEGDHRAQRRRDERRAVRRRRTPTALPARAPAARRRRRRATAA